MDHYHQTTPPTRLKSEVLGAAGSRKGGVTVTAPTPLYFICQKCYGTFDATSGGCPHCAKMEGMGECDAPLDFARVQQALEGGGR